MDFTSLGKWLLIMGVGLALLGCLFLLVDKVPFLGRLPGDIKVEREHFSFYFPMASCLLISGVLSLVFWFFSKFK
jgi:hypothetical protein